VISTTLAPMTLTPDAGCREFKPEMVMFSEMAAALGKIGVFAAHQDGVARHVVNVQIGQLHPEEPRISMPKPYSWVLAELLT
jgi:hypothetical protein